MPLFLSTLDQRPAFLAVKNFDFEPKEHGSNLLHNDGSRTRLQFDHFAISLSVSI